MNWNNKVGSKREIIPTVTMSPPSKPLSVQKLDNRQSTPDSEALMSSDDEADQAEPQLNAQHQQKSASRTNRFNDATLNASLPRKASFASSSMSPTSHPSAPSTDAGMWTHQAQGSNNISRGYSGPSIFSWGSGIWNNDTRKEPMPRYTDVISSPTTRGPLLSSSNGIYGDSNTTKKDQSTEQTIPFPIPLHPTPKTYRSQSYSAGQLDRDSPASIKSNITQGFTARGRMFQHSRLQHRPSRPSMLSEMINEGILSKVKEIDDYDNDGRAGNKMCGISLIPNETKSFEVFTRERASLQQQQYVPLVHLDSSNSNIFSYGLHGTVSEDLDSAIDELDDVNDNNHEVSLKELPGRRFSELAIMNNALVAKSDQMENRKFENVKKACWQSSLGFGGLDDSSQSRRHSFADISSGHSAMGSIIEPIFGNENTFEKNSPKRFSNKFQEQKSFPFNDHPVPYYDGISTFPRNSGSFGNPAFKKSSCPCAIQTQYNGTRSDSPHNSIYNSSQSKQNQPLTIVTFKSSRSEVFYIQEGTGLSLKLGDMVIVEADRGTDLGTVARTNINWATAKELCGFYSEEHHKCLSLSSQTRLRSPGSSIPNKTASTNFCKANNSGFCGTSNQHSSQESNSCNLKPKMIKRLAQKHEIEALREKEGSETKAKRVCIQKVKEHGLNMDILDAEFQIIWMSAINPASFAYSTINFQNSVPFIQGITSGKCMAPNGHHTLNSEHMESSCAIQASRGFQFPYSQQPILSLDRTFNQFSTSPLIWGFSPYVNVNSRNSAAPGNTFFPVDPMIGIIAPSNYRRQPTHYPDQNIPLPVQKENEFRQGSVYSPNGALMRSFLGLSMNSR